MESKKRKRTTPPLLAAIKLVSMNLSGCEPSAEAPRGWNQNKVTTAVRKTLLQTNPDILALQECPNESWPEEAFPGFKSMGSATSHAGEVSLLFRNELLGPSISDIDDENNEPPISVTRVNLPIDFPAVMVRVDNQQQPGQSICVASCHLEPFGEGERERYDQMKQMLQASSPSPLVVAGDTNMRVKEDKAMEQDLKFLDAWKVRGAHFADKYTWNTRDNRKNGGSFNRYYGSDTREYVARYDRVYVSPGEESGFTLSVPSFQLIANNPIAPSDTHFLSDHFGISTELSFEWGSTKKSK